MEPKKDNIFVEAEEVTEETANTEDTNKKKKIKKEKVKKVREPKHNTRNSLNEKKAKIKDSIDEEIDKASKEMEDLMNSINDLQGGEGNVKVVKIEIPKPSFKSFLLETLVCLLVNTLLIVGTSGFITFLKYDSILDIVLFSIYYSLVDRILVFIFRRFFTPFIIRTLGIGGVLPIILSLTICLLFPIFVGIDGIFTCILTMIFVCVCRSFIVKYFRNKIMINKFNRRIKK